MHLVPDPIDPRLALVQAANELGIHIRILDIPVHPVTCSVQVRQEQLSNGQIAICLGMHSPLGVAEYFIDETGARHLGVQLQKLGSANGLILAQ